MQGDRRSVKPRLYPHQNPGDPAVVRGQHRFRARRSGHCRRRSAVIGACHRGCGTVSPVNDRQVIPGRDGQRQILECLDATRYPVARQTLDGGEEFTVEDIRDDGFVADLFALVLGRIAD